jgi:hypothetical protein
MQATLARGGHYDKNYCFTFELENGLIKRVREYMDTQRGAPGSVHRPRCERGSSSQAGVMSKMTHGSLRRPVMPPSWSFAGRKK